MAPRPRRAFGTFLACALLPAALFGTQGARAAGSDKNECLDAHAAAQLLRRGGHLREARARLSTCARATCPSLVAKDCTQWFAEISAEQPTIVVVARDETGRDVADVRVSVDGEPLVDHLDGRPIEVDPGDHVIRCDFPSGRALDIRVLLGATEKDRALRCDLTAPPAPAPMPAPAAALSATPMPAPGSASPRLIPPLSIALGLGGAVALGAFAYFGLSGKSRESHLAGTCRPNCSQEDIDAVRRIYVAADISLAVGIVALAAATWIGLSSRRDQSPRPAR